MTHKLEELKPLVPGQVGIYVCGPTVYDDAHIGHARAVLAFDVLVRHLLAVGYKVKYVRNYTDIDDKIIARAKEKGLNWKELAENHIKSFEEDLKALDCLPPTDCPRATDYIPQMLEDVKGIVDNGLAYAVDGDVYFDVQKSPNYGCLSGRRADEQEAGARVAVDDRKRHPSDFALWKAAKPDEPSWPSPWGPGRPGWHIECSTMSARLLGPSFDIHGGGQDLIFPHHENELAQSAALRRPMATIWAHNGFVNINNEKMSKSLGNFFTVKDILKLCPGEVLRFFLVSKHYRSPLEFSDEGLKESARALDRIYRTLAAAQELLVGYEPSGQKSVAPEPEALKNSFDEALNEDINTAQALGHAFELVRLLNKYAAGQDQPSAHKALGVLRAMGNELALWPKTPAEYFASLKAKAPEGLTDAEIDSRVAARNEARSRKDWAEADRLRKELLDLGVIVEDKAGQTSWRYA
ncbi:MAG: cysteine--tRNA ligase [Deltaproteobacteria bacterium]|jgi:cysteinyl-tRNA synthetase|nr:cysteine--tRNA ligase [Deltaproteobacteria bacterium]